MQGRSCLESRAGPFIGKYSLQVQNVPKAPVKRHWVVNKSFPLTLQKLLCIHMAEFKVTVEALWQSDGSFEDLGDGRLLEATSTGDDNEEDDDDEMDD